MKTIAYLRVSKDSQDVNNQRLAILEFARQEHREIGEFMELHVLSWRSPRECQLDVLLARLEPGDSLIVSELSRMGRSVGEIITTVDTLVKKRIRLIAINEGIRLERQQNLQIKVMVTLFGLFAEIERELISMRTKEAPAPARAAAKRLGRPPGQLGTSKLDGKEADIRRLLALHVSKASIAKITGVERSTLYHFIHSRRLSRETLPTELLGTLDATSKP
jgi:DNA invertase Pin-like site-specific DNA recombinase